METVGELGARLTSHELSEWQAYYKIGGERMVMEDLKAAAVRNLGQRKRR